MLKFGKNLVQDTIPTFSGKIKNRVSNFTKNFGQKISRRKEDIPNDVVELSYAKEIKNSKKYFALTEARNKLEQDMREVLFLIQSNTGAIKEKLVKKFEGMKNLYAELVKAREAEVKTVLAPKVKD